VLIDIVNQHTGNAYNWRILSDGTLWVGTESWPTASGAFTVISQNPADASWFLGVDFPFVLPGTQLDGVGQVGRVEHQIEPSKIRQMVWQNLPNVNRGLPDAVRAIVRQQTAQIDYLAYYEATVNAQSSDGTTLDITPTDTRIAGLQRIALNLGVPGATFKVTPGAKIMLGFMSGDPSMPYVHSWGSGSSALTVTLTDAAGDEVSISNGSLTVKVAGATWVASSGASLTLGTNLVTTPVLGLGSVDSLGVPVTQVPTCTNTVLVG
jgi:hypothetical protein